MFLAPYRAGTTAFGQALSESRRYAGGDSVLQNALSNEAQRSATWHADTQAQINRLQSADRSPPDSQALAGKHRCRQNTKSPAFPRAPECRPR